MESLLTTHNQITPRETYHIQEFLLLHKFNTEELYEEMFDHIATSFEENTNPEKKIVDHLNAFYHQCGGETGLRKIRNEKAYAYYSAHRSLFLQELKTYFRWPIFIYLLAAFASIYWLNTMFNEKTVSLIFILLSSASAIIVQSCITISYRKSCKSLNKPYKRSLANTTSLAWVLNPVLLSNCVNLLRDAFGENYYYIYLPLSAFLITFVVISEIAAIKVSMINSKLEPAL